MKKIIISILGLSVVGLANANEKTGDLKSSATMQATCSISVNPIGFGAVATPLLSQTAQSEMSVKCSNTSAYTIDLAYGGIYGQGTTESGYIIKFNGGGPSTNGYNISDTNGNYVGLMHCGYSTAYTGKVIFNNNIVAKLYGYAMSGEYQDTKSACTSNNTQSGTYPSGWVGAFNASGTQSISSSIGYAYGVMSGMSRGDKLAYSIQVPSDSTKVWNAGNNSYKATGTGDNQIIPMIAKIVPDKSGSKYPAPDMYLDTITAVISY